MQKSNRATTQTVNRARTFKYHELFFSITDPKSKIIYANDVFIRIAGYPTDEIVGELHNKIRHPDMPRAVFKIFWDHLKNKKPVAAYVKNRAKDGAYYWVMALAFPCEGGYMSVRLKPGSELFEKAKKLYADTLKYEKKKEKELGKRKGMYQSEEYLLDTLGELGYASYNEFMWDALEKEMRNREKKLNSQNFDFSKQLTNIPDYLIDLQSNLGKLFASLKNLNKLHDVLMKHSDYMLELSQSILLLSLNAQVGSAKLDDEDDSITVIAENMGLQTQMGEKELLEVQEIVKKLNSLLRTLNFEIISSKLQVEMYNNFLDGLVEDDTSYDMDQIIKADEAIDILFHGFEPTLASTRKNVRKLPRFLTKLRSQVKEIDKFLQVLRYIHTTGKIEVSKMQEKANSFKTTFQELINEVNSAQTRLDELSDIIYRNEQTSSVFTNTGRDLKNNLQKIKTNR